MATLLKTPEMAAGVRENMRPNKFRFSPTNVTFRWQIGGSVFISQSVDWQVKGDHAYRGRRPRLNVYYGFGSR